MSLCSCSDVRCLDVMAFFERVGAKAQAVGEKAQSGVDTVKEVAEKTGEVRSVQMVITLTLRHAIQF